MAKKRTAKPGPRPVKRSDLDLDVVEAGKAANGLMAAFTWEEHPWGYDFWEDVHDELVRLAAQRVIQR